MCLEIATVDATAESEEEKAETSVKKKLLKLIFS